MEKRLFLAIGLSIMVVWLWSAAAPKPQIGQKDSGLSQIVETKSGAGVQDILSPAFPPSQLSTQSSVQNDQISERIEILESDELLVEFSNIGASINRVIIKNYDTSLPITKIASISEYENFPFILDWVSDSEISYSYDSDELKITKSYIVDEDSYIIRSFIKIYNKSNMSKLISIESGGYTIEMSNLNKKDSEEAHKVGRDKSLFEYAIYSSEGIHRKGSAFKFSEKERKRGAGNVNWIGFRSRYFCALIKPQYDTNGYRISPIDDNKLKVGVQSKETAILPQNSVQFDSIIYVGPEKTSTLKEYGLGFEKIKRYYRFGLLDGISKIIGGLMEFIYKIIPNWGISIILISVIIYFSMYPLTLKGMLSMKKMQSLQPMIVKLKEKYKDNPQKMNKEMMALYKEHKVNPLGGCLPMLLQMPVFIGLYQVLWRSVSFKGAKFLWIKDLSEPDRLFMLPFSLPILGNEFNLLPIIMIVVMFFQQKLSSKNMVITDPSQAAQQKMMTTIMPVFLGFIFYKFASGLTLYFTMFYIFSTFTQWKMSKVKKEA